MKQSTASFWTGLVGAGVGSLILHGVVAFGADPGDAAVDTVPRVIPYEGMLSLDGTDYSGALDLCFRVYDDADNPLWLEQHTDVAIDDGLFSVLLGQVTPLTTEITNGDQLLLGITVGNCATGTSLAGRQLLAPAPTSYWATTAVDFTVNDALNVGALTNVTTTVRAGGGLATTGDLEVEGTTVQLGTNDGQTNTVGANNRALVQASGDTLVVNASGEFAGGTHVESALDVSGSLVSGDHIVVNGTSGGAIPSWLTSARAEGMMVFSGSDNAFFGSYQRTEGDTNTYNAVVYWGDDTTDDLIFASEDVAEIARIEGDGNATFKYDVTFNDCRICLYYADNGNSKRYTCVKLVPNSVSPVLNLAGDVNSDDDFQFRFLCDGGDTETGTW